MDDEQALAFAANRGFCGGSPGLSYSRTRSLPMRYLKPGF